MKVLFLAHDYPPVGGGGVQRILHFVRSLTAAGHDVHVVAVDKDPGPVRDDSLLDRHPASVPITRYHLPSIGPVVDLFKKAHLSRVPTLVAPADLYPDASIFHRWTTQAALKVAERFRADVVVASGPPHGIFEAARGVSTRLGAGLVLDMRDPWVEPVVGRYASPLAFHWSRAYQRRCLATADSVVVTAPTLEKLLLEDLVEGRPRRVVTITNGFDGGVPSSEGAIQKARSLLSGRPGVRTVVFAGRLFGADGGNASRRGAFADRLFDKLSYGREILRGRDYHAGPWFNALSILARRRPDLRGRLETVFVGDVPKQGESFPAALEAFPVRYAGYQPLAVAAAVVRLADGLALFNPSTTDDSPSFIIPGKLFEYLAAGPPIFTMCGPGDCADIVQATGAGLWVHDKKPEQMTDQIERWLDGGAPPVARNEELIASYERGVLGRRFVEEVEAARAAHAGGPRQASASA
jgi:glycosyltransferase involved in cell wall biosynthesis